MLILPLSGYEEVFWNSFLSVEGFICFCASPYFWSSVSWQWPAYNPQPLWRQENCQVTRKPAFLVDGQDVSAYYCALFVSSQLRNESAEKEITAMTTSVYTQQSWWVVAVLGGLPTLDYLHLSVSYFLASLSALLAWEHTKIILWSIFQTAKHRWNRCNDPTTNKAYSVLPQRDTAPSFVDLRDLLVGQGCHPKIYIN